MRISRNWLSFRRNAERIAYCLNYGRLHGYEQLCSHLFNDVFLIKNCSAARMLWQGVYHQEENRFTFKSHALQKLTCKASKINIIMLCLTAGGAVGYQKRFTRTAAPNELTFVIRSAETKGLIKIEAWMGGKVRLRFIAYGFSFFSMIPKSKAAVFIVNDLMTWNQYLGESFLNEAGLRCLSKEIIALRSACGFKVVFLVHDHYSICPRWNFLDYEWKYCGQGNSIDTCNECLQHPAPQEQPYLYGCGQDIAEWRKANEEFLTECDEVRTFCKDSHSRFSRHFSALKNLTLVPHEPISQLRPITIKNRGRIVVGVVGVFSYMKGKDVVLALADYIDKHNLNARIIIIGQITEPFAVRKCMTIHGAFERENLGNILEQHEVNVAFFSSIVPETFSYVTQELMMLGLPVVCFDLGAQAERISKYEFGRIAKSQHPESVWTAIQELHKSRYL